MTNLLDVSKDNFKSERKAVASLLDDSSFLRSKSNKIFKKAEEYIQAIRDNTDDLSLENFLKQYSLNSYEGVAIMCLAEALLRIPDSKTADALIKDKLEKGNWKSHINDKSSFFMNSSRYGLMLSGRILSFEDKQDLLVKTTGKILSSISEPIIRSSIKKGMEILGAKFVLGKNINNALKKAKKLHEDKGYLFSFDMLGEAARNAEQAQKFYDSYLNGIIEVGKNFKATNSDEEFLYHRPNVSIKLSALHPRYDLLKEERLIKELVPKVISLAKAAKGSGLWASIDAEESYRLEISLKIFEEVLKNKEICNWGGLGFVLQAYGKRAPIVIDFLESLSNKYNVKIPVRLVKGAYWDSEIKHAQMNGLDYYPVFTKKSHTDLSYLVCAKKMLSNLDCFYPQFASHSALTVASIEESLPKNIDGKSYEFQKLFGMGDALYEEVIKQQKTPVRIYAPVGSYEELLPYLIRRMIENGANNSFVSMSIDKDEPIAEILKDPIEKIKKKSYTGKHIAMPEELYLPDRLNSKGYDFGNIITVQKLKEYITEETTAYIQASSIIGGDDISTIKSSDFNSIINNAKKGFEYWCNVSTEQKSEILEKVSDSIEDNIEEIVNILCFEAHKTIKEAIIEIREAVDFLRFYAAEARKIFAPNEKQKGYTGESSYLHLKPKGIFTCISPWNFPLSIFVGQIAAALVTGNSVIAKPAEQTSKIAYYITKLFYKAGIDKNTLQLLLCKGSFVGKNLLTRNEIEGVCFTGSTETAWVINQTLAARKSTIATFIAETGGQNCALIDSSALLEKACDDIIESAFNASGQKCSAARVLYIQEEIYGEMLKMLEGAVNELEVGEASSLKTDITPVIDEIAQKELNKHINSMKKKYKIAANIKIPKNLKGNYVAPHIIEIPIIDVLKSENFGPILHVIKFKRKDIDKVIEDINSTGYGLTFGIHSRIYDFINYVTERIKAGNIYINRSNIGAVVETHPFGGIGLSGTGPKAGGPEYLKRFVAETTITENTTAIGGDLELIS